MKRLIKIACCLGGVSALGLAGLSAFFFVAGRDVDPPDVSDVLPLPAPPITEAENLVPVLLDATNLLVLAKEDKNFVSCCYRKDGWDRRLPSGVYGARVLTSEEATAWADRILATNAVLFAAFDEAAKRPRAQYPANFVAVCENAWHGSSDPVFGTLFRFETVDAYMFGCLVALRARRLREQGRIETAVRELKVYGEMFDRLSYQLENASLVLYLRSPLIPVMEELVRAAIDEELEPATVVQIDAALRRWTDDFIAAFRRENRYCVLRAKNVLPRLEIPNSCFQWPDSVEIPKWIRTLADGIGSVVSYFPGYRRYLLQPNRTIGEIAAIIRATEAQVYSLPYAAQTRTLCQSFETTHPRQIRWTQSNGYGTAEVNGYSGWGGYSRHLGTSFFWLESNRVAIASARYKRRYGKYPPTLEALVPEFLAEVPRDPFDASRSLGYNAEQGTLHTVGHLGTFTGKVRDARFRYGGLRLKESSYIRRIDGRSMEIPLKPGKGK